MKGFLRETAFTSSNISQHTGQGKKNDLKISGTPPMAAKLGKMGTTGA